MYFAGALQEADQAGQCFHDLTKASSNALWRWQETEKAQQRMAHTRTMLVDPVDMWAVYAEGAWPVRQACMIGRFNTRGLYRRCTIG